MRIANLLLGGLLLLLIGCEATPSASAPHGATPAALTDPNAHAMVRTEMMFGLKRDDGSPVTDEEWDQFVNDAVNVYFPSGFTVMDAEGHWRNADRKAVADRSKVVVIFNDGTWDTLQKFDQLRRLYCQRFGQRSIIRASTAASVTF
jgi:hypothetical protein